MKTRVLILSAVLVMLLLPLLFLTSRTQAGKLLASLTARNSVYQQSLNGPWPSLTEQLQKSGVKPGSALEQLIKDNQDFSLLRLDEATDLRGLPPWARVWWRKSHPEVAYLASDPTGGYPLVLKEIVEWMMWHQDLKPGPGSPPGKFAAGGEGESELERKLENMFAPEANISGEQRISGAQSTARSESDIRINYFDPAKILSASNSIQSGGRQAVFFSTDSGTNWGQTLLPLTSPDTSHSDPTVDWTSDGRGWSSTLGIVSSTLRMRNYVSTDNGANWALDATPSGSQTNVDKQMVWVDHSLTSPFLNRMYAIWHNGSPAFMNRRTAGAGGAWLATPIQVSGAESTGTAIGGDVKTNSAGDVFGFWPTTTNRKIFVVKSTNGGDAFGTPVQIATTFDGFDIGVPAFNSRRALIYVSAGAYKTAVKNLVYATWTDLSGETGCTVAANEPGSSVASTCKTRIWFSRSTDGGATWSAPVKINNQAGLNDQFNQWMAVDETTGALGVMYYDTIADAGRKKVHVYYQNSFNDGVTWSTPQVVTTAPTDETATGADSGNQFGDYNGLSAYAGVLFPSWTDRRGGAKEEVWTAKINDAACTAPGVPTGTNVIASAANQITVSWSNGAPAAAKYNVYRAVGTCESPGTFALIGAGVAATNYVDSTVSGGTTYAYKVTGLDATGNCESAQSSCSAALATGACILPPTFAGLASVTNAATATCRLNLSWAAATPNCGGPVSYQIYRATSTGFAPNAGNLIATINATNYTDSGGLMNGMPYYYVVRAVDAANSVADTNAIEKRGTPSGPVSFGTLTETFEGALSGGGFDNAGWTHQAVSGGVDWVWSTAQSQTPTHSWFSASQTGVSERVLVSPVFVTNANTTLSFWHTFSFESVGTSFYDGGTLEYSTNGGSTWTVMPDASFTAGGFNATISSSFSNPIGGLRAWSGGTIGAMTQVSVDLSAFAGNNLKLRWRAGDDDSNANTGWFVDSVTIANAGVASACSTGGNCPTISITPLTVPGGGSIGTPYPGTTLTASGGAEPYTFSISAGTLPGGVILSSTGVLSGTPTAGGTFNFTVKATDINGCTGTQAYSISVECPAITILPSSLGSGIAGQLYAGVTLIASGGTVPYSFSLMSGALPAGISLSAGGVISGTPTVAGNFNFVIKATDFNGCTGTQQFSLTINCGTVTVSPATLPTARSGQLYTQTITALPAGGNYSFTVTAGALPSGLALAPTTGVLSGTPTVFGTFDFTVQATDTGNCTGTQAYSLVVNPPCGAITVNPATLANGFTSAVYNQTLSATGGIAPYTFAVSSGSLPGGLTLTNGVLSGTPTTTGTFVFTIQATDASGCTGMRNYTVIISGSGLMFYPLAHPVRLLDTRVGQTGCDAPGAAISGGTSRLQTARRTCDGLTIPANAMAITGNITTVQSGGGYLTLYPSDAAQPLVANSNYSANEILNNVFTVGLGNADGAFKVFVTSTTDIVIDVTGYFAPPSTANSGGLFFHPLPKPIRLLETRAGFTGCNAPGAPLPGNADTTQPARLTCDGVTIPNTALAITGNATTVNPQGSGFPYLTLFPANAARPLTASSNYLPGQVMNAPFTVGLSPTGEFKIAPTTQTDLVIDVLGYYSEETIDANGAGLLFSPLSKPVRLLETRAGFTGCFAPSVPIQSGGERLQPARGVCDGVTIATTALGIVGNATVVNSNGGYLTFWPSTAAQPLVATSNFNTGQVFNRHFTVGLGGGDGAFKIYSQFTTDLVIDVSGYFTP